MTAQHPRGPAPCSPAVGRRGQGWGALRAARLRCCFHGVVLVWCCVLRDLSILSPGLPCSHQRVEPATPCTFLLSTPSCKGGVTCRTRPITAPPPLYLPPAARGCRGAPGKHPCTVMPLLTWGADRGTGVRIPRYRRRRRSNLRPACAWRGPRAQGQACLLGVCSAPSLLCLCICSFVLACLVLRVLPPA
jgi:hypothetical protein